MTTFKTDPLHPETTTAKGSIKPTNGKGVSASQQAAESIKKLYDLTFTESEKIENQRRVEEKEKKLEGEAVAVRCAHGDMTLYPLAEVDMELEGLKMKVTAAVSDRLPVSVLLGTDTPELSRLLRSDLATTHTTAVEEALVMTRAQQRVQEKEEKDTAAAEELSGAVLSPICGSEEDYQTDDHGGGRPR